MWYYHASGMEPKVLAPINLVVNYAMWHIYIAFDRPVNSNLLNFHWATTIQPRPTVEVVCFEDRLALVKVTSNQPTVPAGILDLKFE